MTKREERLEVIWFRNEIANAIADKPGITIAQLSYDLGGYLATMRNHVDILKQVDLVHQREAGIFPGPGPELTKEVTVEGMRNLIVEVIIAQQTQGPVTSALIAATLNLSVRTVEDHLKALVTEKRVTEIKNRDTRKNPPTYVAGEYQATRF